jgi:phosphate-selective porin OprO/OprP
MSASSRTCLLVGLGALLLGMALARGQDSAEQKLTPEERDAIRQMIREELKAEQEAKEAKEKKAAQEKKDEERWYEVGKQLDLAGLVANGFRWKTQDEAFDFHVGGRLEWDNAWFSQSDNLLIGPSAGTRYQDGTDMRRARLRADGSAWGQIDFVCEVNFANIQDVANVNNDVVPVGSVGLTEFHVTFRDLFGLGNLRLGHFLAPFGLERYTSANDFSYMERSSIYDAFWGPNDYQSGVMVFDSYLDDRVTVSAAFTRVGGSDLNSFAFDAEDGRYAAGARVTWLPIYRDEGRVLMHVGADYFHQALAGDAFTVANRLPLRAGAGSTQVPNLLATGNFFSRDGANVADLEWALILGPFAMSAEYAVAWTTNVFENFDGARFSGPRGDVAYQAFYVEAGCFLTPGDGRRFAPKTGTWDRTVPVENAFGVAAEDGRWCWGRGAVEVLARLSYLDLVSGDPPLTPTSSTAGARAGRQRDLTLGVNWYLNPQTFFMVNYVWTHVDSVVAGASGDVHAIGARMHFDF